jgi:beta-glucanase (GH16 family)
MVKQLFILLIVLACIQCNSKPWQQPQWQVVWSDEFNYVGPPDSAKWNYNVGGHGWGNNEAQYYTTKELKNAKVENGQLIITAIKEQVGTNNYSSARLITKGKGDWRYGKVEVKAKLPQGRGTWPAIWMLASTNPLKWPDDGEIDIMEHVGYNPGYIHFSVHTKKFNHTIGTQKTGTLFVADAMDAFHIYTIEWNEEQIEWFVDGTKTFAFLNNRTGSDAWPFDKSFHLLLNIAVGGNWGGQQGIDNNIFPQQMLVDYVRVYQLK